MAQIWRVARRAAAAEAARAVCGGVDSERRQSRAALEIDSQLLLLANLGLLAPPPASS
jgi:hypothetical protein